MHIYMIQHNDIILDNNTVMIRNNYTLPICIYISYIIMIRHCPRYGRVGVCPRRLHLALLSM